MVREVRVDTCFFFFNDTATTEIYTLSLHDALPICRRDARARGREEVRRLVQGAVQRHRVQARRAGARLMAGQGKIGKSTRLNSSHANISYAVFCLKKKKKQPDVLQSMTLKY